MNKPPKTDAELLARERLRIAIDRAKIKDKQAAETIGINAAYLSEILNGHRNPTEQVKQSIAAEFGVPVKVW